MSVISYIVLQVTIKFFKKVAIRLADLVYTVHHLYDDWNLIRRTQSNLSPLINQRPTNCVWMGEQVSVCQDGSYNSWSWFSKNHECVCVCVLYYCQPNCVVLRLWQTTSMSYAMSQLLRPLSKSSNKWNPNPIMRVFVCQWFPFLFCTNFSRIQINSKLCRKRTAWWLLLMLLLWLLLSMSMAMPPPGPTSILWSFWSRNPHCQSFWLIIPLIALHGQFACKAHGDKIDSDF
jgi:hypothetical protein